MAKRKPPVKRAEFRDHNKDLRAELNSAQPDIGMMGGDPVAAWDMVNTGPLTKAITETAMLGVAKKLRDKKKGGK